MKKLPVNQNKLKNRFKFFPQNFVWLNIIVCGSVVCLAFLIASGTFTYQLFSRPKVATQLPAEPVEPIVSGKPLGFYLANLTGQQVSLIWFSENIGHASAYLGNQRFTDDRGEAVTDRIHQVTIGSLQPESEYWLMICASLSCQPQGPNWYGLDENEQAEANGQPIRIKTAPALSLNQRPVKLIYGKVFGLNQAAVLIIKLEKPEDDSVSLPLAVLVDPNNGWAIDLANSRTARGNKFFEINAKTKLNLSLILADGNQFQKTYSFQEIEDKPVEIEVKI